jgi:putative two-component system response regulator
VMINGGGYPSFHYRRDCGTASRLVHVCDAYDALCTKRPCRDAWTSEESIAYLESRVGEEFDGDILTAFVRIIREGAPK